MLLRTNAETGTTVLDDSRVRTITLGEACPPHLLDDARRPAGVHGAVGDRRERTGRLAEAAAGSRSSSTHTANAAWFRLNSRVRVDDWSDDRAWQARVPPVSAGSAPTTSWAPATGCGSSRSAPAAPVSASSPTPACTRSTASIGSNGRWSGCASSSRNARRRWRRTRPASRTSWRLQHFAHGCARVFSPQRWALVGEAGVFTDPFYSPGSDFIAMGNDAVTDLVVRDARGEDISARAEAFNKMYLRLFDAFIRLYDGQYPHDGQRAGDDGEGELGQRLLLGRSRRCCSSSGDTAGRNSSRRSSR